MIILRPTILKNIPQIIIVLFSAILLSPLFFHTVAFCWDPPFNNAANWGGTGLMETPNARVLEDGEIRFGMAQALPYRWYAGGMGVFPGLEISFRLTEITNISGGLGPEYGSAKDKAVDLKYQIVKESRKWPALAIGLHDLYGKSQLFNAQYVALSRQVFPFDFTIGLGRGRLGKGPINNTFAFPSGKDLGNEISLFGGIELELHERLHFIVEYNPIEYEKDKTSARGVPQGAEWPINIGFRIKAVPGIDLGISYQRGDTVGFMGHLQFLLGAPLLPKRPDHPLQPPVERRPFKEKDLKAMVEEIHEAIHTAGFKEVSVYTNGQDLTAEFTNSKYLSNQKAAGRVLRILLYYSPSDTKKLTAVLKKQGIRFLAISVKPAYLENFILGKIPEDIFYENLEVKSARANQKVDQEYLVETEDEKRFDVTFGIKPDFETYLNDPSGFFKYRLAAKPYTIISPWKGGALYARYDIPFYSNISSSNVPPPDAIRSDSWKYSGKDYSFDRLLLSQAVHLTRNTFGRLSLGYLEKMYAGIGGEILSYFNDGNLALGIEADLVKKREIDSQFGLLDFERHSLLGNMYYRIPKFDMTLHTQYGRFLAEDTGWMFILSREYETGVILGAWLSYTDTEHLTGFNKDYKHKGVYLSIPTSMFLNHDSTRRYNYSISPWTRDVAQTVFHWQDLFGLGADLTPAPFKADIKKIMQ